MPLIIGKGVSDVRVYLTGGTLLDARVITYAVDSSAGPLTFTLPPAEAGLWFDIDWLRETIVLNSLTFDGNGADVRDEATGIVAPTATAAQIAQSGAKIFLSCDGTIWHLIYLASSSSVNYDDRVVLSENVTGHGFAVGDQVFRGTGTWGLAIANIETSLKNGTVSGVLDADNFQVVTYGAMEWPSHGFGLNVIQYLSPTVPGGVQTAEPTAQGEYSQVALEPLGPDRVFIYDQVAIYNG